MGLMGSIPGQGTKISHVHLHFKTLDKRSLENIITIDNFQISFLPKLFHNNLIFLLL